MSTSMFGQVSLLSKALETSWMRNQVIANNIANVDTPGFKKNNVIFEEYLIQASETNNLTDDMIQNTKPQVVEDQSNLAYRVDGNNVDIDVEMAKRAQNELYYNAVISQVSHQFRQINTVLNAK
ncbi:flagellar basal body rod protein FlgB [Vallitalea okinawensis]|uniref:flagellar basal body rod protein FlgB n=1 Tax=Vallitalea okinawensis TaxID=2078660 RepID=UPI000CFDFF37|nr:flagellar basal body rod protein FlgB [Vallitalea okinawensis]